MPRRRPRSLRALALAPLLLLRSSPAPAARADETELLRRRAAILRAEDERDAQDPALVAAMADSSPVLRARAARALGRIGDSLSVPLVARALTDRSVGVQREAAFALGEIAAPAAIDSLAHAVRAGDPQVRALAAEALAKIRWARTAEGAVAGQLVARQFLGAEGGSVEPDPEALALVLLASWRFGRDADGLSAALASLTEHEDPRVADAALYSAARLGEPNLAPILERATWNARPWPRALAAKGLGKLAAEAKTADRPTVAAHSQRLIALAGDPDPGVRIEALRALASFPAPSPATDLDGGQASPAPAGGSGTSARSGDLALRVVRDALRDADPQVQRVAVELAGRWKVEALAPVIEQGLGLDRLDLVAESALALSSILGVAAIPELEALAGSEDWRARASAAAALSADAFGADPAGRALQDRLLADVDPRVVAEALAAAAESSRPDAPAMIRAQLDHRDVVVRAVAASLVPDVDAAGWPRSEAASALRRALRAAWAEDQADARVSALEALSKLLGREAEGDLLQALGHADPAFRLRASELLRTSSPDRPASSTRADTVGVGRRFSDYLAAAEDESDAPPRLLRLVTSRGTVDVELLPGEAVLTVANASTLAARGAFDGLTFHRVVPGFVAQAGCPRGDGWGGPGWTIRCEINRERYARGAVGMALSGKDTGGSQFFMALSPQPHLDGGYTVFGRVRPESYPVMDALRRHDVILSARVIGLAEPPTVLRRTSR